jgi:histidinol-phosphate aminotransferase
MDISQLIRPNIAALTPYRSARDIFSTDESDWIFLDANENPYETGMNRYPDPWQAQVKKKLAAIKGVSSSNILLGNGSDEVIDLLIRTFCNPGRDNLIVLPPTYGMYGVTAQVNDVSIREVALTPDFQPDVQAILTASDERSKLLFLCSPNNPTGNLMDPKRVQQLLDRFPGIVVIDEAYIDFSEVESWINHLTTHENLVVLQTMSKAHGMAGIRLGMAYAHEEVIAVLNKVKPPYNINQLTQDAVIRYLESVGYKNSEVRGLVDERTSLERRLSDLSCVKRVYPSSANFLLVRMDQAKKRYEQLLDQKIVTRDRSGLPGCEQTLRISVGTAEENEALIATLKELCNGI